MAIPIQKIKRFGAYSNPVSSERTQSIGIIFHLVLKAKFATELHISKITPIQQAFLLERSPPRGSIGIRHQSLKSWPELLS
jgi:hypothetical protein